jgi:hypothetical protein
MNPLEKEQEKALAAAKEILFQSVPLSKRVELMLQTINDVKMKGLEVKTSKSLNELMDSQGRLTDDMEDIQEKLKEELRGFKNSFRMQEAALHEAMRNTDEV